MAQGKSKLLMEIFDKLALANNLENNDFTGALESYETILGNLKELKCNNELSSDDECNPEKIIDYLINELENRIIPDVKLKMKYEKDSFNIFLKYLLKIKEYELLSYISIEHSKNKYFQRGLNIARLLPEEIRNETYLSIMIEFVRNKMFEEALELVEELPEELKKIALKEIAEGYSRNKLFLPAIEIIDTLPDELKFESMRTVAEEYAKANYFVNAFEIIDKIELKYENYKVDALKSVAREYIRQEKYDKAIQVANSIYNFSFDSAELYKEIALTFARKKEFDKAVETSENIGPEMEYIKISTMIEIAKEYQKNTETEKTIKILEYCLRTLKLLFSIESKNDLLLSIMEVFVNLGMWEKTHEIIDIINVEKDITRYQTLAKISDLFSGNHKFNDSLSIIEKIDEPFMKSSALYHVVVSYTSIDDLLNAETIISRISDEYFKAKSYLLLAKKYNILEQFEKSEELLLKTIENIKLIKEYEERIGVGLEVLDVFEEINLLPKAFDLINQIEDGNYKVILLNNLAEKCSKNKDFERAIEIMNISFAIGNKTSNYTNQLSFLTNLFLEYKKENKNNIDEMRFILKLMIMLINN